MKNVSLALRAVACIATLLMTCPERLLAAEAPKTAEQLRESASHVVTGKVTRTEIRSEYSKYEEGGFDYAVWCTVAVEAVEKGEGVKPGDRLVVHCFRPKARLAVVQFFSLQGHSPIPAPGQQVRAHLQRGRGYILVHPNGFTAVQSGQLVEADEVTHLGRWSPLFTLLLPLELWSLVGVLVLPTAVVAIGEHGPRLRRVLRWGLVLSGALWTAGLSVGVIQFLATFGSGYTSVFHAAVAMLGMVVVAPHAALTVWLGMTALRPPMADPIPKEAVFWTSGSTGAAEPGTAPDRGGM